MIILLCLHSIYCTLRLRTVVLTLAVLQKSLVPPAEGLEFLQNSIELTCTLNPLKSSNPETFHIYLNDKIHTNWAYLLLAAIAFLGIFFLVRRWRNHFYKKQAAVCSKLIFQFSSAAGTAAIPIKSFPRLASDLKLSNIDTLKNLVITGQIFQTLNYRCEVTVLDRVGKVQIMMPVQVQIPCWTAQKLKRIFSQSFDVQILLKCDHNFSKILVATQARLGLAPVPPNHNLEVIQV